MNNKHCAIAKFGSSEERVLKQDKLSGGIRVSTVFLGIDGRLFKRGRPKLWETIIFGGHPHGYCERYASRKDALAGHAIALEIAKTRSL